MLVFGSFFKEKFPNFVNSSEVRRIIPACLVLTAFWNNTLKQSHLRNGQVISLGPTSLPFHYRLYFTVDKLSSKKPGFCRSLIGSRLVKITDTFYFCLTPNLDKRKCLPFIEKRNVAELSKRRG